MSTSPSVAPSHAHQHADGQWHEHTEPVNAASGFRAVPNAKPGQADHFDAAPAGVDVTKHVSTKDLLAKAGVSGPQSRTSDYRTSNAAAIPPGTPGSDHLKTHVEPYCAGTGTDGNRVQVMYVIEQGQSDRLSAVRPVILNEVANIDDTFALSARKTGGGKRVRWVTDSTCTPVIEKVTLPAGGIGRDLDATVRSLSSTGHNRPDRKYMIFADANLICGQGNSYTDSRPTGNLNDGKYATYARVDTGCWVMMQGQPSIAAHELMHAFGAVQNDAPHKTDHGHATDGWEAMVYPDGSSQQIDRTACPQGHTQLLDCNNDDYFSTNPPAGSYLASRWNTANSSFLANAPVLAEGPTVTVKASNTNPVPGEIVTLTATSSDSRSTYEWQQTEYPDAFCDFTGSNGNIGASVQVTCSEGASGNTAAWAVRATQIATNGQVANGSVSLTFGQAKAPTLTVSGPTPAQPVNGETFRTKGTASGVAPFRYQWTVGSDCQVAGTQTPEVSITCPNDQARRTLAGELAVTQSDGQVVRKDVSWTVVPKGTTSPTPQPSPTSPTPQPSPTTDPDAPVGLSASRFMPLSPFRVLDTREGLGATAGPLGPQKSIRLSVAGAGLVPARGVKAVVLNVTAVGATANGYVTVWPSNEARPTASNLNTAKGVITPNLVVVKVGDDGAVNLFNSTGSVHLVADLAGYYTEDAGSVYSPVNPARLLDTREGHGAPKAAVAAGQSVGLKVTGAHGVPSTGVSAVALNVTAVGATANGYVTAWPSNEARPKASNLNTARGLVTPNMVIVKVGSDGRVSLFNSTGSVHLIADIAGYYTETGAGSKYTPLPPARMLDTREASAGGGLRSGEVRGLQVSGFSGVPAGVTAVALNVTSIMPSSNGYITVFPSQSNRPVASNLNNTVGRVVPNLVIVKVGPDGKINLFNNVGSTHLVVDIAGYYAN